MPRIMTTTRREFMGRVARGAALALASPLVRAQASEPAVVFLERDDPEFERHRTIFNKGIERRPATIALCSSESGVVQAVQHAKGAGLPIAIKSGGHCFEGYSLNDGGLVID